MQEMKNMKKYIYILLMLRLRFFDIDELYLRCFHVLDQHGHHFLACIMSENSRTIYLHLAGK